MHAKPALFSVLSCLALTFVSPSLTAANLSIDSRDRGAVVADLMHSWQQRILAEKLPVEDARNWAMRNAAKFARLTDAQLDMARKATTLGELELLFVTAPIANGTSINALATNTPGDISIVRPSVPTAGSHAKFTPAANPTSFDDLVFTAVTPCRVYDSRYSTAPRAPSSPAGSPWIAGSTNTIDQGPQLSYAFQGGQATGCMGTLVGAAQIAAVMTAVSTVNQGGAGYLVFFSYNGVNPNPYGVAQWFQPGYVQTSFVVMPTDLVGSVYSSGYIGNAASHVIIDVLGYFAEPKTAGLECQDAESAVTPIAAGAAFGIAAPACPAGFTHTGPLFRNSSSLSNLLVINNFYPAGSTINCQGTNGTGGTVNLQCGVRCCRQAGR